MPCMSLQQWKRVFGGMVVKSLPNLTNDIPIRKITNLEDSKSRGWANGLIEIRSRVRNLVGSLLDHFKGTYGSSSRNTSNWVAGRDDKQYFYRRLLRFFVCLV